MLESQIHDIHDLILKETEIVLETAKAAIQKIITGNDITIHERDSILEIGLSHRDFFHLQIKHGSKIINTVSDILTV